MKNNNGFVFIEFILVIIIIGVLGAVVMPNFIKHNNKVKCKNDDKKHYLATQDFFIKYPNYKIQRNGHEMYNKYNAKELYCFEGDFVGLFINNNLVSEIITSQKKYRNFKGTNVWMTGCQHLPFQQNQGARFWIDHKKENSIKLESKQSTKSTYKPTVVNNYNIDNIENFHYKGK